LTDVFAYSLILIRCATIRLVQSKNALHLSIWYQLLLTGYVNCEYEDIGSLDTWSEPGAFALRKHEGNEIAQISK